MRRVSIIVVFLIFLLSNGIVSAQQMQGQPPPINWNRPEVVRQVANDDFFLALQQNPQLIQNENVFSSFEQRLANPDVAAYVSRTHALLNYWAQQKKISFEEGAGLERYDNGRVITKGKQVAFKPEYVPKAVVLQDGSVKLQNNDDTAVLQRGEVLSSTTNLLSANTITIQNAEIVSRGNTLEVSGAVTLDTKTFTQLEMKRVQTKITREGTTYTLSSEGEYALNLMNGAPVITNPSSIGGGKPLRIQGTEVPLILEKSGSLTLQSQTYVELGKGTTVGVNNGLSDKIQMNIKVTRPTAVCFAQCSREEVINAMQRAPELKYNFIVFPKGVMYNENVVVTSAPENSIMLDINYGNTPNRFKAIYADSGQGNIVVLQTGSKATVWYDPRDSYFSAVETNQGLSRMSSRIAHPSQAIFFIDGATVYLPEQGAHFENGQLTEGSILVLPSGEYNRGPAKLKKFNIDTLLGKPTNEKERKSEEKKKAPPKSQTRRTTVVKGW